MKRFLVFLLVVVGPMIGFGQTLRTTINAGILSQGNKGITATKLNNVLVTVADSVSSKANKSGGVFSGTITAPSFVRAGGTSLQFLKADGSVDASAFAILGNNNVFTGTNTFLTPVFANSVSTSAFSSITGAWSNTGNLGVFSLRYNTKSGGNTVNWNPVRLDANGFVGIGMDPTQAFEVAGAAKFNSAITATSLAASGAVSALSYSSTTGANFATSSGNSGFGIASPSYKLHVVGGNVYVGGAGAGLRLEDRSLSSRSFQFYVDGGALAFFNHNNSTQPLTITDAGNVGIGVTVPAAKLHIESTGYTSALIRSSTTTAGGLITLSNTVRSYSLGARGDYGTGQFNIVDETSGTLRLTLSQAGNLLIGSSASDLGFRLNVDGTAQATQFKLSALNTAPASATATGVVGEIRIDASYIYICTATNTWKRSALTTW